MARKKLGYVELEWTCPVCDTRNPGTQQVCSSCGAPQPDDVKFEAAAQDTLITDEETLAKAEAGADIHCPYCDARNPATATTCRQCGGDLTEGTARASGEIVGAFDSSAAPDVACPACATLNPASAQTCKNCGAPLPQAKRRATTPPKSKPIPARSGSSGCMRIIAAVAVIVIIAFTAFIFFSRQTDASVATVTDARWLHSVEILGLVPVEHNAWHDEIPDDGTILQCTQEVRRTVDEPVPNSREVCGTPYTVDQGNGFAEVVTDCEYQVLEDRCNYTVPEWQIVDEATWEGVGITPEQPVIDLAEEQRVGEEITSYLCILTANDESYTYRARSLEEFARCEIGSRWNIEVNTFGNVVKAIPVQ